MQSLLIRWALLLVLALPCHSAWSASSDFNGDGNSDIVWRQVSTGRAILYLMNGGSLLSSLELGGNTDWSAVATGDFNGDGKADILWRQASTGSVLQNLMNTGTVLASTVLGGNTDWVVAGVADFNGDGKSDILWRQVSTGRVIMYLMNGGTLLSTFDLGGNTDWNPVATGDFNGDAKGDILWRQVSTGKVLMYLMNGGTVLNAFDLGGNTDWNPVATGDFNGDGKSDILWRQVSTGKVLQYQMNGGSVLDTFDLGGNTDWNPVVTGDFNGDGKADILWGQVSTGSVIVYLLNGPTILSTAALGGNTDWGITGGGIPAELALINLSTSSLSYTATQVGASPVSQAVTITLNSGAAPSGLDVGAITFGPGAAGWIQGPILTTLSPSTALLRVFVSSTNLRPGTYTATIPVQLAGVTGSSQNLAVHLTVSAGGLCPTSGVPTILVDQTVSGAFAPTDCQLATGSPADVYLLTIASETDVVIDLTPATANSSGLSLYVAATGFVVATGRTSSLRTRLTRRLDAGSYFIQGYAGSVGSTDTYQLSVAAASVAIPFDGHWVGTTDHGRTVSFLVQLNQVVFFFIDLGQLRDGVFSCSSATIFFGTPADLVANSFAFGSTGLATLFSSVSGSIGGLDSATGSYGTVTLNSFSCNGRTWIDQLSGRPWTAARR